jgi:phage shock protein A
MPGLSGRMSTVIKAKVSHLLDRAEDPAETLDYSYEKQLEQLQNVKRGIADVVTAKKRLQLQETSIKEQTAKLDEQAHQAMAAGREDLARAALERKHLAEGEMQSLDQQVAQLEDQQQKLTDSEQKLNAKVEAFRTKKEVIKAQYSAAEAQVQISSAATGVGEEMADVGLAMQRAGEDRGHEGAGGCGLRARGRGHVRGPHRAGAGTGRHRPPARTAGALERRRRGPRQAQGRARARHQTGAGARPRRGGRGAAAMIIRIFGEGQYELPEPALARLHELDAETESAVSLGDSERFHNAYDRLLEHIRAEGARR